MPQTEIFYIRNSSRDQKTKTIRASLPPLRKKKTLRLAHSKIRLLAGRRCSVTQSELLADLDNFISLKSRGLIEITHKFPFGPQVNLESLKSLITKEKVQLVEESKKRRSKRKPRKGKTEIKSQPPDSNKAEANQLPTINIEDSKEEENGNTQSYGFAS